MAERKLKSGDAIPIDGRLYYEVVKPFEKQGDSFDDDYSYYKVGDIIAIYPDAEYTESFMDFIRGNCRGADTEKEKVEFFNRRYSNACVGKVYESGSYKARFFYIVEREKERLLEVFYSDRVNCFWALDYHIREMIGEMCDIEDTMDTSIGFTGDILFIYDENPHDGYLKIGRKATPEEVQLLNEFVNKKHAEYRERFGAEERLRQLRRQVDYQENKSNPNMYPGVAGNFRQTLYKNSGKLVPEKRHSFEQIKSFFEALLESSISEGLKESMIFYGGTIPYLLCDEKKKTRKFGDVDIFVPVHLMQRLREEVYFEYVYDSMELTRAARLTAKGGRVDVPWLDWDESEESDAEFDARVRRAERRALDTSTYQDYGFKAVLYGVNVSVFPLYDWKFEDGTIGVCAKSFKIGQEEGDWKFLLNTIVSKGITVADFSKSVTLFGHTVRVAKPEYTVASKINAIRFGYIMRRETDMRDLQYILEHKDELEIDENEVKFFMESIPDYGVSCAYRISRSFKVSFWTGQEYKYVAMSSSKPS